MYMDILCRYFRKNSNVWLPKLQIINDSDYGRHMIIALIQQVLTGMGVLEELYSSIHRIRFSLL